MFFTKLVCALLGKEPRKISKQILDDSHALV